MGAAELYCGHGGGAMPPSFDHEGGVGVGSQSAMSVSWRWLCRVGVHTAVPPLADVSPCRREARCGRCDRLLDAAEAHEWGKESKKDAKCVSVVNCRRCAKSETRDRHRLRDGRDVRLTSQGRALPQDQDPCRVYQVCLDCKAYFPGGYQHDKEDDPPYRCRRCGHWDDDTDA